MTSKANMVVGAVVAVIVVAALAFVVVTRLGTNASAQLHAVVHDSAGEAHEISLSKDSVTPVVTDLGTNVVEVKDGAVFVSEADCDGQDCVHQGAIDAPGKQIICLPHKLWIEVVPEGGQDGAMDVGRVAAGDESASSGDGESDGQGAEGLDAIAR